jgi:hypothetical protein
LAGQRLPVELHRPVLFSYFLIWWLKENQEPRNKKIRKYEDEKGHRSEPAKSAEMFSRIRLKRMKNHSSF